jgi:hypothetical protein
LLTRSALTRRAAATDGQDYYAGDRFPGRNALPSATVPFCHPAGRFPRTLPHDLGMTDGLRHSPCHRRDCGHHGNGRGCLGGNAGRPLRSRSADGVTLRITASVGDHESTDTAAGKITIPLGKPNIPSRRWWPASAVYGVQFIGLLVEGGAVRFAHSEIRDGSPDSSIPSGNHYLRLGRDRLGPVGAAASCCNAWHRAFPDSPVLR